MRCRKAEKAAAGSARGLLECVHLSGLNKFKASKTHHVKQRSFAGRPTIGFSADPISKPPSYAEVGIDKHLADADGAGECVDVTDLRQGRDLNREARIQAASVEWIRLVAPQVLVFAVPNGGLRSKAEAARMRWTGVVAGIPDLVVIAPGGRAYFIEVKAPGGSLSPAQRDVHECLAALGTPAAIVRSIEDARLAFAAWGIQTREAPR